MHTRRPAIRMTRMLCLPPPLALPLSARAGRRVGRSAARRRAAQQAEALQTYSARRKASALALQSSASRPFVTLLRCWAPCRLCDGRRRRRTSRRARPSMRTSETGPQEEVMMMSSCLEMIQMVCVRLSCYINLKLRRSNKGPCHVLQVVWSVRYNAGGFSKIGCHHAIPR